MSTLEPLIGQRFAYASGRTGVLQQLLLSQPDIDRLLGAHDRKDTEKILTELKLTSMIDQGISTAEGMLKAVGAWMRAEVELMSPEAKRPVFNIVWLERDRAVLSYLLKKYHKLTSGISKEPETSITAYSPESLRTLVDEGKEVSLPSHLVQFVQQMRKEKELSPQRIDAHVAQFIADLQLKLARASGSKLIIKYVTNSIDVTNIRLALRNYSADERAESFIEGGEIPVKTLMGDKADVLKAVNRSSLPYELDESIIKAGEDPIALERACADVIAGDIADMWNVPLSIEPLFAFAAIALSNLFLIRSVLIGKGNELAPQEIKQMLPPFIPATHYRV